MMAIISTFNRENSSNFEGNFFGQTLAALLPDSVSNRTNPPQLGVGVNYPLKKWLPRGILPGP